MTRKRASGGNVELLFVAVVFNFLTILHVGVERVQVRNRKHKKAGHLNTSESQARDQPSKMGGRTS